MSDLLEQVKLRWRKYRHDQAARAIIDTPPIVPYDDDVVLFSMIGTRVVLPYLVAVKSLVHHLQCGRVVILNDGTLTGSDRELLARQLGDPPILESADIDTRGCPTYTSWKRLFALLELRRENYVIQLDSDTVTIGDVPELAEHVQARRSFILKGEAESEFTGVVPTAEQARAWREEESGPIHVQMAAESVLDRIAIPGLPDLRYVRGCAGFAGFRPNPEGTALAEAFSAEIGRLIGFDAWKQWGSEQVTSNFLIANDPGSALLPYDRYCNFWNEPMGDDMRFVHFIGTYRYHGGVYAELSRQAIARLEAQDQEVAVAALS